MLLKYKQGRTIILSTHHMDEAELLGDRIAIISEGKLQCCGTSLFLKNALGEGNNLTLVKDTAQIERDIAQHELAFERDREQFLSEHAPEMLEQPRNDEISASDFVSQLVRRMRQQELVQFVRNYIPSAVLKEDTLREYQLVVGLHERANPAYWAMFKALEENLSRLRVTSYGIHDVSLEEIFIKAVQLKSKNEERLMMLTEPCAASSNHRSTSSHQSVNNSPTTLPDENPSENEDENESSLTSNSMIYCFLIFLIF